MTSEPKRNWRASARHYLQDRVIDLDDHLDGAWLRLDAKLGRGKPRHIAAYRGYAHAGGVELFGRVLAEAPQGGPREDDDWWDNLVNTYRRFESDEVPNAALRVRFRGREAAVATDHEGYYALTLQPVVPPGDVLWDNAIVSAPDGTLATPQPVLQVDPQVRLGVISDIDDTLLLSGITDIKVAAQLTFLHNARTRKPLQGAARLYQALQAGVDGRGRNPVFYVSSSPWNLYDLLEDFMELNGIPCGPIFLRDIGTDPGKFLKTPGHGHKLDRARRLIGEFPRLRWVLLGDSGQADAELYAEAAQEFGDRIAAIYIRDVDPDLDSPFDRAVDAHIERVAGTRVPMLRVRDSLAIAEHAAGLGLIDPAAIADIAREVARDAARPTLGQAAVAEAAENLVEGAEKTGTDASGPTPPDAAPPDAAPAGAPR